jgi:ElaB/YqjD/DUF883 family membrane-anchored ribosome-binding protein
MENKPEVIRKDMEETRTALTEKLEALESQVADTVKETTEAVSETIENVKDTVEEVTDKVKETAVNVVQTFNLSYQAEHRPWVVLGGSVGVGFLLGWLSGSRSRKQLSEMPVAQAPSARSQGSGNGSSYMPQSAPPRETSAPAETPESGGALGWIGEQLGRLKGVAVGSLMGVVRDLAQRNLPETVGKRVSEEVDRLTRNLGGEPLSGSVLPEPKQEDRGQERKGEERQEAPAKTEAAMPGGGRGDRMNLPPRRR